jgi:3-hydroxybutyryl-CoA dehydratase
MKRPSGVVAPVKVSLKAVADEIGILPAEFTAYLNRRTGEVYTVTDEDRRALEDPDDADLPDWQRDAPVKVREIMDSADWLALPTQFDVHEYAIMKHFCFGLPEGEQRDALLDAIQGGGAFRRFKSLVRRQGTEQQWHDYRDREIRRIVAEWLDEKGIAYEPEAEEARATAPPDSAVGLPPLQALAFEDLSVGMTESYSKTVKSSDVVGFAEITGDRNPIHLSEHFAAKTPFKGRIAHGLYTAGLISAVIGTRLPGPGAIYISQTLKFLAPVKIGDTVDAMVEVVELIEQKQRVRLSCRCKVGNTVVLEGEAIVKIPLRAQGLKPGV